MGAFLLGVASSIVAAVVGYSCRYIVGPAINLAFFRMYPNVSGKYLCEDDKSRRDVFPNQRDVLILRQFANRLSGYAETYSGEELKGRSAVHGRVTQTRIIILWSESVTPGHHNYGAGVYRLNQMGTEAVGDDTSLCVTCGDVTTIRVKLTKLQNA